MKPVLRKTKEIHIRARELEKMATLLSALLKDINFKKKCRIVLEHDPAAVDVLEVFTEE